MVQLDPNAAIAYALAQNRWRASGLCLEFVDHCFGTPGSRLGDNGGPPNGSWQEAKDGFYYSRFQHPGDPNPPAGVPVYWETGPSGNTAGHIVLSLGDGWCRTTDYDGAASVSTQTIASITRARRTAQHPDGGYLGWTEDYGGNPITGVTSTALRIAVEEAEPPLPSDGAFYRIASGEGAGSIYAQEAPGWPLYSLTGHEWAAYAANAAAYADFDATAVQALLRRVGVYRTDDAGRRVLDPNHWTGFGVYQP